MITGHLSISLKARLKACGSNVYLAIRLGKSNRGFQGRSQTSPSWSPEARRAPCCSACCDRWEHLVLGTQPHLSGSTLN